ncbi:hypothetical protein Gotri_014635 [Gossypium trilobum]|uniref:Uncharacterized protein n=1 Tax=Gossypium trilobum TaxID=34281 RepID=A0A7J9DXY5_9ROSI|nr:hypothetical protein [Gossypium trilobum]
MSPTPLISILTENKLNGDNFRECKRNLLIVLNCEKQKFILDETCPLEAQPKIMTNLEDLLGGQVALARQSAITNLMNSQQKIGTLVKEHILKLTGFLAEAEDNGVELDVNTQIKIVFKSLINEFSSFRVA